MDVDPRGAGKYTLATIPASKLLNYAKREDIERVLGPGTVRSLENQAKERGEKELTSKMLKQLVAETDAYANSIRDADLGQQAFRKYQLNYERMVDPANKAKRVAVRKAMSDPRKGYLGCIATKVKPRDIKECVQNYDRDEYKGIEIVPVPALKQSVYEKTGAVVLAPPAGKKGHISYLPKGLRKYALQHPHEYDDYLEERRAELEYLRALRRNATAEQRAAAAAQASASSMPSGLASSSSAAAAASPDTSQGKARPKRVRRPEEAAAAVGQGRYGSAEGRGVGRYVEEWEEDDEDGDEEEGGAAGRQYTEWDDCTAA